jgi:PAS domain S-box-containing protein
MTSAPSVPPDALGRDPEDIRTSEAKLRQVVDPLPALVSFDHQPDIDALNHIEHKRREDESEDIRLVVDTIPTLAWSARPDGSAEFFNQRWLDYTGLSAKQALGSGWEVAIHPDDLPRILDTFREALNSVKPYEVEGRFRRFDGEFRWFLFRGSPLRDRSGAVAKWYGTNTDLEERKRAEEALRKSEERWRSVFENSAIGVALTDHNGRFLTTNHVFQAMMGYTEEELRALHILDLTHEDYRQANWALITELLEGTRRQFQIEKQHRRKDGSLIWVSNNVSLVPGTERVPRFIMALSEDITQRKRAEDTLRSSEAFLLDAQRLTRTCSWRHEVLSGKVTVSAEGLAMYGIEPEDDASSADFYHRRKHPQDRPEVEQAYAAALRRKSDFEAEFRIVLPDGTTKHIRSIGHPILDERGDVVEFVGASIDVTEHHRARADLEKAFEEIKRLRDQLHDENVVLREQIDQAFMFEEIVGTSSALQGVLSRLVKVAPTDSSVLVSGETGTGKELVARAIHKRSRRAQRPFVSVNCAALAPSLISSELFGHEKGAFTGALQRRLGRFELANGGTIFLDEIGDLPLDTQVALLRVLQEREFERVGGTQPVKVDVRVIAATNRDLEAAVADGTFRPDLYYRLNVFPIQVPPLRERQDDVLLLLEYFVHRFARKMGKHFKRIDKRTVELFRSYPWPGNIRELQNVVERSVIVSSGGVFCVDAAWLSRDSPRVSLPQQPEPADADQDASRERQIIEDALAGSRGRVSGPNGAAVRLRVPPSTLEHRIKKLRIRKNHFKLR